MTITSVTSHGMARKMLKSKKESQALASAFGKDIPKGQSFSVELQPGITMTNKRIGNARRIVLVGTPYRLKEFLQNLA